MKMALIHGIKEKHFLQNSLMTNPQTFFALKRYLNLKKFNLQQSGDFWLSETPKIAGSKSFDSAFPRLCTWVKIQDKSSKKIFYVFNTHLDHLKGETRVKQARVLQEQIKLINQDGHPYLICGDFNEGPSEDVHQLLIQSPLIDPWIELKLPEETSFHRFQENFKNGKRIDWIVCTNEIEIPQIFLDKEINFPLFPSDHYPVIAHFSLKD